MRTNTPAIYRTPSIILPGMFAGIHFQPGGENPSDNNPGPENDDPEDDDADPVKNFKQSEIQAMIDAAVARNSKKHEKDANKLRTELEGFKNAPPKNKGKEGDEQAMPLSEFNRLKSEWESTSNSTLEGYKAQINNLLSDKKRAEIHDALSGFDVVDSKIITQLVDSSLAFDDEGALYVRKDGKDEPRYSGSGLMTVKEFVAEFLKDKDYLLKSRPQGGGGSKPANGKAPGVDLSKLSPSEKIAMGLNAKA